MVKAMLMKWLAVVMTITLVGGLSFYSLRFERVAENQKTLFYQLELLRTSIQLYRAVRKTLPQNLESLAVNEYQFSGDRVARKFLEFVPMNKAGRIADPFGNPYRYDAETGWVKSNTPGYEFW